MLLAIYIIFQIIAIVALFIAITTEAPLVASISAVTSGMLMVGAWVLNVGGKYVWDVALNAYVREAIIVNTGYLAVFNILLFGLSVLYFFYDIFSSAQKQSPKIPEFNFGKNGG